MVTNSDEIRHKTKIKYVNSPIGFTQKNPSYEK